MIACRSLLCSLHVWEGGKCTASCCLSLGYVVLDLNDFLLFMTVRVPMNTNLKGPGKWEPCGGGGHLARPFRLLFIKMKKRSFGFTLAHFLMMFIMPNCFTY